MEKGKVYLIGAGPGDAGLITKKGYEYLNKSDVVVYDRLVNKELLADLDQDVRLIYVGKTAQHHTKTQDETNEILYQEAKAGNIVARLKGGDPYVFGRGGEEGEYLFDRDIEFEEVPGITSAIGGLAYAGIPITHRGVATSFHVITGHLQEGSEDLNWNALSQLKGTLVFLMGVGNLENITNNLIKEGKNPETRAAIINWGTTTRQKVVEGKLSDIYEIAVQANIKPPSLIVIGDVVDLREKLNFHERKPLFGKNIVITRERKSALSTIEKFKSLGANVISFPTIKTVEIKDNEKLYRELDNLNNYEYLVFTSVNGVDIFFKELFKRGLDTRALAGMKIAAVGPKTADSMEKFGIVADIVPDKYVAEELIDVLKPILKKEDRVLIPRAKIARPKLVEELKDISVITEVEIYETIKDDNIEMDILEEIEELENYYLVYTSSSTFTNFKEILGEENKSIIDKGKIISIGPITSETVEKSGYPIYKEARDYTIDGIIDILIEEE